MKLKVLNRLKLGRDIAAEMNLETKSYKGWVWINPTEEKHPDSELPGPEGKFLVSRLLVPIEFLEVHQDIKMDREDFYFDDLEEALSKAEELTGSLENFDAPFNLPDFPL